MADWIVVLLGWPAIGLALGLSFTAIARRRGRMLYAAAGLMLPFAVYIAASPRFEWLGLLLPLCLAAAGVAVRRKSILLAWLLVTPVALFCLWLFSAVATQHM
jgi:hypothetical protein